MTTFPTSDQAVFPGRMTLPAVPEALQSWQQVHGLLLARSYPAPTLAELSSLGSYHYWVYKLAQHPPALLTAQGLQAQLLLRLQQEARPPWSAELLDYACAAAALSQYLAAAGVATPQHGPFFATLDHALAQQAQRWSEEPATVSRAYFFQVVHYFSFSLRRSAAVATKGLQYLLGAPTLASPALRGLYAPTQALELGLDKGVAAGLLRLINLAQSGIQHQSVRAYVRTEVAQLLALKQDLDFTGQRYALFPYQVLGGTQEPAFSAELSWRRGDTGLALLLYKASQLFEDAELWKLAELVGLNTLLRTTPETTHIASSPFRQGAAGVAQVYQRLYLASKQLPKYYQGHLFWLQETQRWLHTELPAAYYQQRASTLREGLPGVGLVLLSAATGTSYAWEDSLL